MAKVIKKIRDRQTQSIQITYFNNSSAPGPEVFVNNATVDIMNISLQLLKDLYSMNTENEWVKWIAQGFEYDINFRFEVSAKVAKFLPVKMIRDWPVLFVVDAKRPVHSFRRHYVSRAAVADIADKSVVVLTQDQRLTADAEEIARFKDIQLQVRNDVDCIWQK